MTTKLGVPGVTQDKVIDRDYKDRRILVLRIHPEDLLTDHGWDDYWDTRHFDGVRIVFDVDQPRRRTLQSLEAHAVATERIQDAPISAPKLYPGPVTTQRILDREMKA